MKLAHRLLVFALGVIILLTAGILAVVDGRLRARITDDRLAELHREANLVAGQRMSGVAAIDLAKSSSVALGGRVTLVDIAGVIVGDAYRGRSSSRIGQPAAPPHLVGRSLGRDAGVTVPGGTEGAGGAVPELHVSVRNARGVTRVAVEAATIDRIFDSARWEVLTAGFIAAVVAMVFSIGYAIYVSGPVIHLRDHAQALALRDYSPRPEVDAPGELGELATSLMQLSVQLESLETVRREFVANVSHELCSPLTIASGFAATLVKDDPPTAVRRQFARAILSNTTRMQRVVDDLLDLSRIEGGGWLVRAQTVRLGDTVSEVFDSLGPSAAANGTALVCDWSADAAVLHADLAAVRQILSNLTENAIRYTSRGIITIFSETTAETVCIGVRDTGV
ncbi:MAG: HAMP domain-containing protein, partial [Gemmatimonadota bacterium]|nr:HAMP domain-containing protein [Gemmatimonadota bacterium]